MKNLLIIFGVLFTLMLGACSSIEFTSYPSGEWFQTSDLIKKTPAERAAYINEIQKHGWNIDVWSRYRTFKFDIPKKLTDIQVIEFVKNAVQKVEYVDDKKNWGIDEYWATPQEFFANGGDCEDTALAAYFILREYGIPASKMRVLLLDVPMYGSGHAILEIRLGDKQYIIENNKVPRLWQIMNYIPEGAINEDTYWEFSE